MSRDIKLFTSTVNTKTSIQKTLESGFISSGDKVIEFEGKLNEYLNLPRPVTVNTGSAGIHIALIAAGVKEGDEVILPAQMYVGNALPILYLKAKPVFVDIEFGTGNIDATKIEEKITEKTKAIIVVDWGGYPCNLDETTRISKKYKIPVIQDAGYSLGAKYKDMDMGGLSNFTCFSFQAIKPLTTGDGGAVCSLTEDHEDHLKKLRSFGINRDSNRRTSLGERDYNLYEIGYEYGMNNITATIGLDNLMITKPKIERVKTIAKKYDKELKDVAGITPFNYASNRESSYWLYGFHVERRNQFIKKMNSVGIETSVVHMGIDKNNVFGGTKGDLINQRKFDGSQINIPINYNLSDMESDRIIKTIKEGW